MLTVPQPYPDPARLLLDVLVAAGLVDAADTGSATPEDLQARTRFVRARRLGGADDGITDLARVDVDWFLPVGQGAFDQLRDEAEAGRQLLTSRPHRLPSGVLDAVTTTTAPVEIPADDDRMRRRTATYTVRARRTV